MYAYIKGIVTGKTQDSVIIEAGGIGYLLNVSLNTLSRTKEGETTKLFTYFHVREDAQLLFGFSSMEEKTMFERLLAVSGVGPKVALSILSTLKPSELALAVVTSDAKAFEKVSGVGKKTAQRIILELKERIKNDEITVQDSQEIFIEGENSTKREAISALRSLGYDYNESAKAVSKIKIPEGTKTEEIILLCLKQMDNRR